MESIVHVLHRTMDVDISFQRHTHQIDCIVHVLVKHKGCKLFIGSSVSLPSYFCSARILVAPICQALELKRCILILLLSVLHRPCETGTHIHFLLRAQLMHACFVCSLGFQ